MRTIGTTYNPALHPVLDLQASGAIIGFATVASDAMDSAERGPSCLVPLRNRKVKVKK